MPPIRAPLHPLSMLSSHIFALLFSCSYVGSLYVAKNARLRFSAKPERMDARRQSSVRNKIWLGKSGSRDNPAVIRARLTAATLTTVLNCGIVYALVARSTIPSFTDPLPLSLTILGIRWPDNIILSCLQTPLLFLGPLYGSYLAGTLPGQARFSLDQHLFDTFWTWVGFRNYVWGPLTEEVVFRACVLSVYAMGGATRWKMIVLAPLVFGLVFQTAYMTLFGAHTSYLFLRPSSLLAPLVAHVFCNIMGFPQMQSEMQRFPAQQRNIIAAYILGVLLFFFTLVPFTETKGSLYWRAPEAFWRAVVQGSY
ncbi:hypothetical protein DFH06DRAFT_1272188 [Mycena polygramma]|nr:hypothetical protein DFH06DRAFT_1272188 [Mycena polygramma]